MILAGPSYIISKLSTISALKNFCLDKLELEESISNDLVSSLFVFYGFVGKLIGPSYGAFLNDLLGFNVTCNILILIVLLSIIIIFFSTDKKIYLINNKYSKSVYNEKLNISFMDDLSRGHSTQIFLSKRSSKKSILNNYMVKNHHFEYKNDFNNFSEIYELSSYNSYLLSKENLSKSNSIFIQTKL